jgi:hypothetical protein
MQISKYEKMLVLKQLFTFLKRALKTFLEKNVRTKVFATNGIQHDAHIHST